ncbi:hypothetical protein GALL_08480 [mine drainage metagenome]|uniref:Uncharacterized protein n=1 Tax=mine drainage metagenome TaxID=410659 RepID=A0A1J5TG66_9ZZZZ
MPEQKISRPIRVTFDTNTLERAVRPERFPKDPHQAQYQKVRAALQAGTINGFMCETIVTCEGIQKVDRPETYGSMTLSSKQEHRQGESGEDIIHLTLTPEMPKLKPLHKEMKLMVRAALNLRFRMLGVPRIGGMKIDDPDGEIYVQEVPNSAEQAARLDRQFEAIRAIEERGVGIAQVKSLADKFAKRAGVHEPWFKSLERATDIHERNAVSRAVAEWADGDAIGAHIGYGIEYFCTEDAGKSAGGASIMDAGNRAWLKERFGIKFLSLKELDELLNRQ